MHSCYISSALCQLRNGNINFHLGSGGVGVEETFENGHLNQEPVVAGLLMVNQNVFHLVRKETNCQVGNTVFITLLDFASQLMDHEVEVDC